MKLSMRTAILSTIVDGGFHIYPAGKLNELIKKECPAEKLKENFEKEETIALIRKVSEKFSSHPAGELIKKDFDLICSRLEKLNPEYDFENELIALEKELPAQAEHYFGIKKFKSTKANVVEYYFEGYNDIYKDADWYAFNVSPPESIQLKTPIGTYFKRSWIVPFSTQWGIAHENIHQMTTAMMLPPTVRRYVPWIEEGLADLFGLLMLYRIYRDKKKIMQIKRYIEEVEVLNPRKATYYYGLNILLNLARQAGLSFIIALATVHMKEIYNIDFDALAKGIRDGQDPRSLITAFYRGHDKIEFERRFERAEKEYGKDKKFDHLDFEVINLFSTMQPPAALEPAEYTAGLWIYDEATKNMKKHYVEESGKLKKISELTAMEKSKIKGLEESVLILESDIPKNLIPGATELANKYFVVKHEVNGQSVFDAYSGGLPFRFGCQELRCALQI